MSSEGLKNFLKLMAERMSAQPNVMDSAMFPAGVRLANSNEKYIQGTLR